MKKSQLRKIIRESIRGLMNEVNGSTTDGAQITSELCWCNPNYPVNAAGYPYAGIDCDPNTSWGQTMSSAYITINNQTPVLGQGFTSPCPGINANGTTASAFWTYLCTWKVTSIGNLGTSMGNRDAADCPSQTIPGCTDSIATNYDPTATVDDGSCTYDPTDCTKANWLGHINTNYPQINDPSTNLQLAHFCEYCNDGTIPPMTDSFCKCCDPIEPCQPPKGGCIPPLTWNQAACKCERGIAPIREEVDRMQKLANIK